MYVKEKGFVVLDDLLVDREGIRHERLILRSVGEDYGAVLAEPFDCDGDAWWPRWTSCYSLLRFT